MFGYSTSEPATPLDVDLSTLSAATDVAFALGEPSRQIVDLNFQSGPDAKLPGRLLLYNSALHARHNGPVDSILILLRKKADGSHLTGKLAYGQGDCRIEFHHSAIRLWEQPVEGYLNGGLAALTLAAAVPVARGSTAAGGFGRCDSRVHATRPAGSG